MNQDINNPVDPTAQPVTPVVDPTAPVMPAQPTVDMPMPATNDGVGVPSTPPADPTPSIDETPEAPTGAPVSETPAGTDGQNPGGGMPPVGQPGV